MEELNPDTSYLLYGFAGIFFLVSIIYFGIEVVFELSPVTKSYLLLSMTSLVITTGVWFSSGIKSTLTYIMGFLSYIIFLVYTLAKFSPATEVVFASLLGSAVLFAVTGRLLNTGKLSLDTRKYLYISGAVLLLVLLVTAVDMTGSKVEYQLDLPQEVEMKEGENTVGQLTVSNDFILTRSYEIPDYMACTQEDNRRRIHLDIGDYRDDSGNIRGQTQRTFDVNITSRELPTHDEQGPEYEPEYSGTYSIVELNSCPTEHDNRTIYVYREED